MPCPYGGFRYLLPKDTTRSIDKTSMFTSTTICILEPKRKIAMRIKSLLNSKNVVAGDGVHLRELVNAHNDPGFSGRYSLAEAILPAGLSSTPHRLSTSELYFVISGQAVMHIDKETAELKSGDAVEIPPNAVQWVDNRQGSTPFVFLCIVDPAWRAEDEEIL